VYPWLRGLLIYYSGGSVFTIVYQILYQIRTLLSLQPYSCCDVEVLALTDGGRDFGAEGGSALCNKRRSHVIEKVVLLTWKKIPLISEKSGGSGDVYNKKPKKVS
jgi:hypothetical protein